MVVLDKVKLLPYKEEVSISLPEKGLIAIIGPNGAGKSTLLKSIIGLTKPISGYIHLNGKSLTKMSFNERRLYLSYLAQNTPIYWDLKVSDLIMLGFLAYPLAQDKKLKRFNEVINQLGLFHLTERSVFNLSGGELARVHMARLILANTPIIIADEPTASLDPYYQIEVMSFLSSYCKDKLGIIVLHDLSLALRFCQQYILVNKGKIHAFGNKETVMTTDNIEQVFQIKTNIDSKNSTITILDKN